MAIDKGQCGAIALGTDLGVNACGGGVVGQHGQRAHINSSKEALSLDNVGGAPYIPGSSKAPNFQTADLRSCDSSSGTGSPAIRSGSEQFDVP